MNRCSLSAVLSDLADASSDFSSNYTYSNMEVHGSSQDCGTIKFEWSEFEYGRGGEMRHRDEKWIYQQQQSK